MTDHQAKIKEAEDKVAEIDEEISQIKGDYYEALSNDDANRIDQCEELLAELKKLRKSAKQRVYRLRSQW